MVTKIQLEVTQELQKEDDDSNWTPNTKKTIESLWSKTDGLSKPTEISFTTSDPEVAAEKVVKKRVVDTGPPISKEEALKRFLARKATGASEPSPPAEKKQRT
jgi:hypothetical protein